MMSGIIIFTVLGILATLAGIATFVSASNPLVLAMRGSNPAVIEIEALLVFIIAAICLVGASILSALKQFMALLKSRPPL